MSKPSTFTVKIRPSDNVPCIFLRDYNVVVAEFVENTYHSQQTIAGLLDRHAMAVTHDEKKEHGIEYTVFFGGGSGDDVWDREATVFAVDFEDAAKQAKGIAEDAGGVVFSVSQEG